MHNSKLQTVEEVDFELEQNNEYQLEPLELILEKMMDAEPEPRQCCAAAAAKHSLLQKIVSWH